MTVVIYPDPHRTGLGGISFAAGVIYQELHSSRLMGALEQYGHNDSVSLLVKVIENIGAGGGRRAFKFRVCVDDSEEVDLVGWEGSPAADVDWEVDERYQLENVLVKQWSSTTELNATKRTTAKKLQSKSVESDVPDSEIIDADSTTDRCRFTWIPDKESNPTSRPHCCYRNTWRGFDRCIWHAETGKPKPPEALAQAREQPENRKLNASPRELLSGAVLRNAELTDLILTAVDFSGANFRNANLTDVYLSYSNLSNADLRGADLTDCTVSKISLTNSDLRTADLTGLSLFRTDFTDAELADAIFTDVNLKNPIFTGANPEAAKGITDTEIQSDGSDDPTGTSNDNEESSSEKEDFGKSSSAKPDRNPNRSSREWDVDSLAAATTLDTEDIEDAVDRLTTAGCSHNEAIGYVRRYLTEMLQGDGLFAVYGVGPSNGHVLVEAGITTVEELRATKPHELSARSNLSIKQIHRLQEAVKEGNFSSLDPDNEKVAEQLFDSPVETSLENSGSERPSDTERTVSKEDSQAKQSNTESTTESQTNSKETTSKSGGSEQEVLTPSELPVPSRNTFTVPGGGTVFPNYLSEYYESFRSAKRVLELVFQIPGINIDPDDRRDPRVQYYVLLDACIGFGDVSSPFAGYGPQHQDRLPFSIREYRKAFGDGDVVTDYRVINLEPFGNDTHKLLRDETNVKTTREFVRPCVPGTNYPLPELPGSFEELQEALRRLATFPAYPPLPSENGINDRTIPIADIYRKCFEDLNAEYQVDLTPLTTAEASPPTGPVPAATPTSTTEAESALLDFGRLSHLFKRVTPPAESPANRVLNVFALDWYRSGSASFEALQALAKYGEDSPIDGFRPRLQDLIHRRFLLDTWDYDYITVFPGHEAGSLSPQLVELARDAVLETDVIYTPLLERTETIERQREKSKGERQHIAIEPSDSLRTRAKLKRDTVILFDDICTTGSSLLAGAHLLQEAGADRVVCISLGLTPGGPQGNVKEITDPKAPASEIIAGLNR